MKDYMPLPDGWTIETVHAPSETGDPSFLQNYAVSPDATKRVRVQSLVIKNGDIFVRLSDGHTF